MIILERLGTITLLGFLQGIIKIGSCTGFFYLIRLFDNVQDCILLAVSLFASDNFHTMYLIQDLNNTQSTISHAHKKEKQN